MQEAKAYICDETIVIFSHQSEKTCFLWSKNVQILPLCEKITSIWIASVQNCAVRSC